MIDMPVCGVWGKRFWSGGYSEPEHPRIILQRVNQASAGPSGLLLSTSKRHWTALYPPDVPENAHDHTALILDHTDRPLKAGEKIHPNKAMTAMLVKDRSSDLVQDFYELQPL